MCEMKDESAAGSEKMQTLRTRADSSAGTKCYGQSLSIGDKKTKRAALSMSDYRKDIRVRSWMAESMCCDSVWQSLRATKSTST